MAEDVILTQIKLDGADQVQDDLRRIGEEGNRAFAKLADAANQQFSQVTTALTKVSDSLDRFSRARIEINTDRANQALENIARVTDQLSRQLERLGQPGARSLQDFNRTAQESQQQVRVLETTTVSAFNNIADTGVSAFTLLKNTINDGIRTASNYKTAIAGIFTGGLIGFAVNEIQNAVKSFNDLKKAASDAKIPFDDYQKANFLLREMGLSAKDSTDLLTKLGQRADDFKKVKDALNVPAGSGGRRMLIEADPNTGVVTKTIIQDLTKINELNQKLKSGAFGDPNSFEAIHKYRTEMDALQKSTDAAAKSHTVINPFVKTLGRSIDEAIKGFSLAPTTDNLKKVVDEVNKLGDSGKRVEEFKKAFGGAEAPAKALEEALNTNTLDEFMTRWEKIARLKKEDEKSTEALDKANKNFGQAMFEVGAATEQGRISFGLMFAPTLAPAIDAIANGIRTLNLDLRKLANDVGKDIGPAIEQIFNIFKGKEVDTTKTGMFTGLIQGFKGLVDAAQPALDIFNSFFQTSLSLSDVGIGAALTGLVGGFNALAIAVGAVFTVSTPGMEKFKDNLKGIGIDIDGIKERVLNFARGLREAFRDPGQRSEMFENIKKSLEGLPTLILGVVAAFALLRTGAGLLGRALGAAFGVKISAEATILGVALAQISGVLPTINTLASTFAGIMVGLNATLSILIGLLGWPIILAAGLVLLVTNFDAALAAANSFAKVLNSVFGTEFFTGARLIIGVLGLIVVRLGLAALAAGLFNGAITAAGTAAGAAAAGGFAALLATVGRIAIAVGIAASLLVGFKAIADEIDKAKISGRTQSDMNEIKDLNIQNRRDEAAKRKADTDDDKAEIQKRIDARKERLKELNAPGTVDPARVLDDANKKTEDSQKDLMDRLLQGWDSYQKKLDEIMQKGAESRAKDTKDLPKDLQDLLEGKGKGAAPKATKPRNHKLSDGSEVVYDDRGGFTIKPPPAAPAPAPAQKFTDGGTTGVTEAQFEAEKAKINDLLKELATNAAKEIERALAEVAKRAEARAETKPFGPEGGGLLAGEEESQRVQDLRGLSPQEFFQFQEASDLVARFEALNRQAEDAKLASSDLAKQAGADDIAKFGKPADQAQVAPAQEALATATTGLTTSENTLKAGVDGLTTSLGTLQTAVAGLANALTSASGNITQALNSLLDSLRNAIGKLGETKTTTTVTTTTAPPEPTKPVPVVPTTPSGQPLAEATVRPFVPQEPAAPSSGPLQFQKPGVQVPGAPLLSATDVIKRGMEESRPAGSGFGGLFDSGLQKRLEENQRVLEGKPPAQPRQPEAEPPDPNMARLGDSLDQLTTAVEPAAQALDRVTTSAQTTTQALELVAPALEEAGTAAQTVPAEVSQAEQSFEQIDFAQAEQAVFQFVESVNQAMERLSAGSIEGAATGGLITGPGTDTSDSIPILASANEFMVRAAAVRHYGRDFMYRVNSMQFPRLAMGGLIDHINSPLSGNIRLPRYAEGGPIEPGGSSVPVHVNFEGRRVFSASAQRSSIEQLKRESLLQKVRSGGPSPFWVE